MSKKNIATSKPSENLSEQNEAAIGSPEAMPSTLTEVTSGSHEPPLSLEAAKLILDDILTACEYEEWAIDGLIRLLSGIMAHKDYVDAQDYTDWVVRFLYAESPDFNDRMRSYLSRLPAKSYRDDGLTIDQIAEVKRQEKAAEIASALREKRAA